MMSGRVGYECDEFVISGRDGGAGMDASPFLLAGYSRGGGLLGARSYDVACHVGSSVYGGISGAHGDASGGRGYVC